MKLWSALVYFIILPFFLASQVSAMSINEFVPDSDIEWVEFYNDTSDVETLKSYFLDDDTDFYNDLGRDKKSLNTLNTSSTTYPYIELSSFLNNPGDYVVLFDSAGAIVDQYQYTDNPGMNTSIGRHPDGSGGFSILSSTTKGSANSEPRPSPTPSPSPSPPPSPSPSSSSSTPIPSPSPTPKASVLGTTTSTKKPSPSPTLEPVEFLEKHKEGNPVEVLGAQTATSPQPEPATKSGLILGKGAILSWILTISGAFFLIAAAIPFVRSRLKSLPKDKPDTPS